MHAPPRAQVRRARVVEVDGDGARAVIPALAMALCLCKVFLLLIVVLRTDLGGSLGSSLGIYQGPVGTPLLCSTSKSKRLIRNRL